MHEAGISSIMPLLPKKIFFAVSSLLAIVFAALSIRMLFADPSESCSSDSVAGGILTFACITGISILLWTGCFLFSRLREWLAFIALFLQIAPMSALNSSICCHESYGNVPTWMAAALIAGFLSYSLLFVGRAIIPSLACVALVIYLFLTTG